MEFILYTAVTIIFWALSVSFLLPFVIILKFNKTIRDMWFSWLFVRVIEFTCGAALRKTRKRAFDILHEHLPEKKRDANFEILEIGFGGGMNLPFYPKNSNLTALDMNESFRKYFEESREKNPQITYKKVIIATAENMHEIDDDTFDIVVCTYVLCSVPRVHAALAEVKRVLKPGGKFLFVEHILYPGLTWRAWLQKLTNPIWRIYTDGCNINRNHDEEIEKTGFSNVVTEKYFLEETWLYVRPIITGIATK